MNLTTRAAQTACAEPGFASRKLHLNEAIEPKCARRPNGSPDCVSATSEVQHGCCPVQTENQRFGMALLGVDYDSSVA